MNQFISYYRISNGKSGGLDSYGIESQKAIVTRYINQVGGSLVQSFEEVMSGARSDRPQMALALALALKIGATLIFSTLSRASRDLYFILQLQKSGVKFVCADMPNADTMTLQLMGIMVQRERDFISSRTKAGLAIARSRNVRLGAPLDKLASARISARRAVQERQRTQYARALEAIRQIQSTNVQSKSMISNFLNLRGIPVVSGRGGKWTTKAVVRVLRASESFAIS